ncbi:MAG: hypothetical protein Q8Q94_00140 [bacterium]|nr:hypothetical protein [bacterium]
MSEETLSGKRFLTDTVIWMRNVSDLTKERKLRYVHAGEVDITVPPGHRSGGVSPDIYDGYRQGLDSACADVVITTRMPDGEAGFLAVKRALGKPFGGKWWMQGGAIHSYRSIESFLVDRAERECGVSPVIQALIGVFRTCAEDFLASTTNLCYVGFAPYHMVERASADKDHIAFHLFSAHEFRGSVYTHKEEWHWYPIQVFNAALDSMPD